MADAGDVIDLMAALKASAVDVPAPLAEVRRLRAAALEKELDR